MIPTTQAIQQAVCSHFGLTRAEILSPTRERRVARPRQIGMYLTRRLTSRSLPEIGRAYGGRDHSTVHHAVATIVAMVNADADLVQDIDRIAMELLS